MDWMPEKLPEFRLTDFRQAGFLTVKKVPFLGTDINTRQEVVFIFNDESGLASSAIHSYPGSEEQQYDAACKAMHDLVKMTLAQNRG